MNGAGCQAGRRTLRRTISAVRKTAHFFTALCFFSAFSSSSFRSGWWPIDDIPSTSSPSADISFISFFFFSQRVIIVVIAEKPFPLAPMHITA